MRFLFLLTAILNFGSNSFCQNIDIHSYSLSEEDEQKLHYADSLLQRDFESAENYLFELLNDEYIFKKPDFYTDILNKAIGATFLSGDILKSDSLYQLLLDIPIENIHPYFVARIILNQSRASRMQRKYLLSLDYAKKSLFKFEQNSDLNGQLEAINVIIRIYNDLGNHEDSKKYVPKIEQLLLVVNDKNIIADVLVYLSKLHTYAGQYQEAQSYILRAKSYIEKNKLSKYEPAIYYYQAVLYYAQKNYAKAQQYFENSAKLKYEKASIISLSATITFQAAIAMRQKKYQLAEYFNREALKIRTEASCRYLMGSSNYNIANTLIHQSKFDSALYYINQAEELYSIYKIRPEFKRGRQLQMKAFLLQKDYKKAYNVLQEIIKIDDSIYQHRTKIKLDELESEIEVTEYEQEKLKLQAKSILQKTQNNTNKLILKIILYILIFAIVFSYLLYLHYREKHRRRLLLINQQMIFIQMNSHFVFNALTAIQSLIFKKRIESAIHYLTVFSNLVKKVLSVNHEKHVVFKNEISFVIEYLQLQKLRFGDDLRFHISISEDIHHSEIKIPPLLLYPYIEYAVEECVQSSKGSGMILIQAETDSKYLYYRIVDINLGFSNLDTCYIKRFAKDKISCKDLTHQRISLYNTFLNKVIQFKREEIEYNNNMYPSVSFKIKK